MMRCNGDIVGGGGVREKDEVMYMYGGLRRGKGEREMPP